MPLMLLQLEHEMCLSHSGGWERTWEWGSLPLAMCSFCLGVGGEPSSESPDPHHIPFLTRGVPSTPTPQGYSHIIASVCGTLIFHSTY